MRWKEGACERTTVDAQSSHSLLACSEIALLRTAGTCARSVPHWGQLCCAKVACLRKAAAVPGFRLDTSHAGGAGSATLMSPLRQQPMRSYVPSACSGSRTACANTRCERRPVPSSCRAADSVPALRGAAASPARITSGCAASRAGWLRKRVSGLAAARLAGPRRLSCTASTEAPRSRLKVMGAP